VSPRLDGSPVFAPIGHCPTVPSRCRGPVKPVGADRSILDR
jgi:hypothetical protein